MESISLIKDITIVINSFILVILFFKHFKEIGKQRLEYDKLQLEIQKLKKSSEEEKAYIIKATKEDIEKYFIKPTEKAIKEATNSSFSNCISNIQGNFTEQDNSAFDAFNKSLKSMTEIINEANIIIHTFKDILKESSNQLRENNHLINSLLSDLKHGSSNLMDIVKSIKMIRKMILGNSEFQYQDVD